MGRNLLAAGAAAVLVLGTGYALAQAPADPSLGPPPTKETGYLAKGALDGAKIIGPPPAADSAHGRADRTFYDETRALEGSEVWKRAIVDNDLWGGGALKRFSCALDVALGETETPTAWKLLHKLEIDVRTVGGPAKGFYNRTRPLIGNDKPICVPREDWMRTNASYPSGHSMTAWTWALLLAEASPSKADAVLQVGREGGESRVICGVHFPSDVEAGRTLGSAMVARLHADKAFAADFKKAKAEIAKAKAKPTGCGA